MKKKDIIAGKKVLYSPYIGCSDSLKKEAVIVNGPYEVCGTDCCMIDIISSVVAIENLEELI